MDTKAYELLEKIYYELQETRKELKQDIARLESDVKAKQAEVLEKQETAGKRLDCIESMLSGMSQRAERSDIKIQVIETSKVKKTIGS